MKPFVWGRERLNLLFEHNFSLYLYIGSGNEAEDWCMYACFWPYYMNTLSNNLIEMPTTYYFNSRHLTMNSLRSILLTVLRVFVSHFKWIIMGMQCFNSDIFNPGACHFVVEAIFDLEKSKIAFLSWLGMLYCWLWK